MGIFKTYSNSKKELPDVFIYDAIEIKLKNQIYHIWNDFFDQKVFENYEKEAKEEIFKQLCRTEGKKKLYHDIYGYRNNYEKQVEKYFEELSDVEKILDVIQITFYYVELVEKIVLNDNPYTSINYSAKEAIGDLNYRFKENGVGYEYSNGKIIRIDNKLLHQETIKFTLLLLSEKKYKNANDEFIKAHEHFKHRRNHECLNECLKSFESTMKIICDENKWPYNQNDTAKPLINILITNKFLPSYNESSMNAIKQLLEGSIPTVRNKNSAHGAGNTTIVVPDYLANYMLYLTGATIRLLVDTQNNKYTI